MNLSVWKYRLLRRLSRLTVEIAGALTLRRMPPFTSAAAIVFSQDRVLMIRDTAQGGLVLPGGHLHWNESIEDGIRREVFEETGYRVEPTQVVGIFSSKTNLSEPGIIRVVMEARIVGGRKRSSAEGAVEWVEPGQPDAEEARDAAILGQWTARAARLDDVS